MIRHTVLFEVKPETTSTELDSIFEELMLWKTTISGILSITCGKCKYDENKETHPVKNKLIDIVVMWL